MLQMRAEVQPFIRGFSVSFRMGGRCCFRAIHRSALIIGLPLTLLTVMLKS